MSVLIFLIVVLFIIFLFLARANKLRQIKYIDCYPFNKVVAGKLKLKYPEFDREQHELIVRALKDYFLICHKAKKKWVSMPSQVVDEAWHEFILSTKLYENFCRRAFGYFLHHTPAESMPSPTTAKEGIKRAWKLICAHEAINPKAPNRLPLLFGIDAMLEIPGGFVYSIDCTKNTNPAQNNSFCASHISCASGCVGDSSSFFDSDASGCGGDSSCGSGCGGD